MTDWVALDRLALTPLPGRRAGAGPAAMTQARLRQRVADWCVAFRARGGDAWALHVEDAVEFAAVLFGAWHAGVHVILPGDDLPATRAQLRGQVAGFVGDIASDGADALCPLDGGDADALRALDPDRTRLTLFTSGSTGAPVAIEKRLGQLAREVEALEAAFGNGLGNAVVHGTVSHQHIYGLLFRVLWPLAAGRAIGRRLFFHEDLQAALAQDAAVLVTSPAHLKRIPEQLDWSRVHGRLRAVFSSGGALPDAAARTVSRLFGIAPTEVFGSSETGGVAWRQWQGAAPAWQALPGVRWRLAGGVLEVDSPHLPAGTGWWRSQDRAEADPGGGFRLLGREDRIVKVEERRVSLDALERRLTGHPWVDEARVIVLPGGRTVLAAALVPTTAGREWLRAHGRRALGLELGRHLADSHEAVARPRRWRFVEALPVNAQGKLTDAALLSLFRAEVPPHEWMQRDDDAAELEIVLEPALAVFDGHFPQATILPGVAQLDWAIRFGREAFALPARFLRLETLKFQRVARPGMRLQLYLQWQPERSALEFRYASAEGQHASGRAVFGDGE